MFALSKMKPKKTAVEIKLVGGAKAKITLRPFTLADYAWFQDNFDTEEKQFSLADAKVDAIAEIIWYQMTIESKKLFGTIVFKDVDDDGEEIEVEIKGYKKLLHAVNGEDQFWRLLDAYLKCKGLNGFIEKSEDVGLKKKWTLNPKAIWTGLKYLISSPFNTVTRQNRFFH